jgi:hypothetical protein
MSLLVLFNQPSGGTQQGSMTMSGGMIAGGAAAFARVKAFYASGGMVVGGGASMSRGSLVIGSSGLVMGGSGTFNKGTGFVASGGAVLGGVGLIKRGVNFPTSGGLIVGGSAGIARGKVFIPSGGIILGGAGKINRGITLVGSGGIVAGGLASFGKGYSVIGSGGIVLGGLGDFRFSTTGIPIAYPTTETLLSSLKAYIKTELKTNQKIISTVKAGLVDERDELPMVTILPLMETIHKQYNEGLFDIERTFKIDIIVKGYSIEEIKSALRKKITALRNLFSTNRLDWNLMLSGRIQIFDYELDSEILDEPLNIDNQYVQFASIPLRVRSYYKAEAQVVPEYMSESDYTDLLDYLYSEAKTQFTFADNFWRDYLKPVNFQKFPAVGILLQDPDEEKVRQSSTEFTDLSVIYRIYSSLATKEVAFLNHLRNVETVKTWILNRPSLDGRVGEFRLFSIDYGIDAFTKPFQGAAEEFPVFRSDFTVGASLIEFREP